MSNYIITSDGNFVSEEELYHYGVVGMKWGVRHDPLKAYERATKKLKKRNDRADRAAVTYGKNAGIHLTDLGIWWENKMRKRSARATARAVKWKRAMDKTFSDKKLSSLEKKYTQKGEAYLAKIGADTSQRAKDSYTAKSDKYYAKANAVADLRKKIANG